MIYPSFDQSIDQSINQPIFAADTRKPEQHDDDSFIVDDDDNDDDDDASVDHVKPDQFFTPGRPHALVPHRTPLSILNTPGFNFTSSPEWVAQQTPKKAATPAQPTNRKFKQQRTEITAALYAEYNARIFGSVLPADLKIVWSNTLNTTAGRAVLTRRGDMHSASIELSSKV